MTLLHTLLSFLVALGALVIIHELGHYGVARWCGVKVLRFSVGMGKVIYSRKFGPDETEWAVSMLPLGGYVKMLDMRENPDVTLSAEELKREFTHQSVWRRIAIVAAGPLANFLLAIALFTGLYMHGIPEPAPKLRAPPENSVAYRAGVRGGDLITGINGEPIQIWSEVRWKLVKLILEKRAATLELERSDADSAAGKHVSTVTVPVTSLGTEDLDRDFVGKLGLELAPPTTTLGEVVSGGAAALAGLQSGDDVLAVDGVPVLDWPAFVGKVSAAPGRALRMSLRRAGQMLDVSVTPAPITRDGKLIGQIGVGIAPGFEILARSSPTEALSKAVDRTWDSGVMQLEIIGKILSGSASVKNITGPITIADYAGQSARLGWVTYLGFIAAISIGLGIMNLLPIPVLDGGLLLYYSLEVLTGRPVSERIGQLGQRLGIGLLMTLMALAVFNDVARLLS